MTAGIKFEIEFLACGSLDANKQKITTHSWNENWSQRNLFLTSMSQFKRNSRVLGCTVHSIQAQPMCPKKIKINFRMKWYTLTAHSTISPDGQFSGNTSESSSVRDIPYTFLKMSIFLYYRTKKKMDKDLIRIFIPFSRIEAD